MSRAMRVALAGAGGRMGRTLIEAVLADKDSELGAAFDLAGNPAVGTKVGDIKTVLGRGLPPAAAERRQRGSCMRPT